MKEFIALLPLVVISALGCFAFGFAIWSFFKCLPKRVKEKIGLKLKGDRDIWNG